MPLTLLFEAACILVGAYILCGLPVAWLASRGCSERDRDWLPFFAWACWPFVVLCAFAYAITELADVIRSR